MALGASEGSEAEHRLNLTLGKVWCLHVGLPHFLVVVSGLSPTQKKHQASLPQWSVRTPGSSGNGLGVLRPGWNPLLTITDYMTLSHSTHQPQFPQL